LTHELNPLLVAYADGYLAGPLENSVCSTFGARTNTLEDRALVNMNTRDPQLINIRPFFLTKNVWRLI